MWDTAILNLLDLGWLKNNNHLLSSDVATNALRQFMLSCIVMSIIHCTDFFESFHSYCIKQHQISRYWKYSCPNHRGTKR